METKTYEDGYRKGAEDVIDRISGWLDEDTVSELRERFIHDKD